MTFVLIIQLWRVVTSDFEVTNRLCRKIKFCILRKCTKTKNKRIFMALETMSMIIISSSKTESSNGGSYRFRTFLNRTVIGYLAATARVKTPIRHGRKQMST